MRKMTLMAVAMMLLLSSAAAHALGVSGEYNRVSLADALADIASRSQGVKINFISDRLDAYPVTCSFTGATPLQAVRTCVGFYPVIVRVVGDDIFVEASRDELPRFAGRVTDSGGMPVEFATVRIFNTADTSFITGGVTSAGGDFAIPVATATGTGIVRVAAMGMRRFERVMDLRDAAVITLDPEPVKLRGVSVTQRNLTFRDNTLVSIPTRLEVEHSADMLQLLMQQPIPGIFVDPVTQALTVMGSEPVILVDGVRRDTGYLMMLDPAKVARVEYTTDVPQKYYSGIPPVGMISVFMKERTNGGNVRANLTQAVNAGFTMGGASAMYNRGRSEFVVSYDINRRDYDKYVNESASSLIGPDFRADITENSTEFMKFTDHTVSAAWNFKASEKVFLSVTAREVIGDRHTGSDGVRHDSRTGTMYRRSDTRNDRHAPLFDVFVGYTPGERDRLEFQATTQVQNNSYDRMLADSLPDGRVDAYPSEVGTHYNFLKLAASWTHDLRADMRLTVNANGYTSRSRNIYRTLAERFVNNEEAGHVSGRIDTKAGNVSLGLTTGLRYVSQRNEANRRRLVSNQSSLNMWMPLGKKFGLGFIASYFPGYPTLSAITEMEQDFDGDIVNNGNASLKNSQIFNLEENVNFNSGAWWASFRATQYMAHHLTYYRTTWLDDGRFLYSPMNLNNHFDLRHSVSAGARGLLGGHLSFNVMGMHMLVSSCAADWRLVRNLFLFSGNATAYLGRCSLTLSALRNAGVNGTTVYKDTPQLRLSFDWTPLKGLNLQAGWWYIAWADGSTTRVIDPVNPKYNRQRIHDNHRMVTLRVAWNFDFGRRSTSPRRAGISGGASDVRYVQ